MSLQASVKIILHATEDAPKFYGAIKEIFDADATLVSETVTEGHYGNAITVLHVNAKKHAAEKIVRAISKRLSSSEMDYIMDDIISRISDSGLHLRLDKQEFVQGRLSLEEGGAVRVRIYTPVYVKKNAESEYRSVFER